MNVIHLLSTPAAGGAEVYVKDLSLEMVRRGHSVHIMFLESAMEGCRDELYEDYFLQCLAKGGVTYSFIGAVARRRFWIGGLKLRSKSRELSADLVHCHLYYGVVFSFFTKRVPIVYTHHSFELRVPRWLYLVFDLKISRYIGICSACSQLLHSITRKPVVQIDNAVDEARIEVKCASTSLSPVSLLFVGRLVDVKNIPMLLHACSQLQDLDFLLTIAGEGPERHALEQLSESLNLSQKVRFVGNVVDISKLLHGAEVFVMSSTWEGLPIALIEAAVAGLPVVVTDAGGCSEVVSSCKNGYVVDAADVASYVKYLSWLIVDAELRSELSENAKKNSSKYKIKQAVTKHYDLYEELVGRTGA